MIKAKGRFLTTHRTEGISTSDLLMRIIGNCQLYRKHTVAAHVSQIGTILLNWYNTLIATFRRLTNSSPDNIG